MPNNPATRRAGAEPVSAANKIVRRGAQATEVDALASTLQQKPSGDAPSTPDVPAIPPGVIVMWSGTLATVPLGWKLCDGTDSTPDLRDRFIEGWTNAVDPGGMGGNLNHSHAFGTLANSDTSAGTPAGTVSQPTFTGNPVAAATANATPDLVAPDVTGTGVSPVVTATGTVSQPTFTGSALGNHTHTISGNTAATDGRPPFYKLAFIMKT